MQAAPWSTSYATLSKSNRPTAMPWRPTSTLCRRGRDHRGRLSAPKSLERNDGARVLHARNGLYFLGDEVANIRGLLDVKLDQQVEIARRRIDFRGDFGIRQPVGHLVGLPKLA